jgi:hypothetical protein
MITPEDRSSGTKVIDLISKLSSPRFSERVRANQELMNQGESARAALEQAFETDDLELKAIIAKLLDQIEGQILFKPKRFSLDIQDQPLEQLLTQISKITSKNLVLISNVEAIRNRRLSLRTPNPVTFWEIVNRIETDGKVKIISLPVTNNAFGGEARVFINPMGLQNARRTLLGNEIVFGPSDTTDITPVSYSGVFRFMLSNIHLQRDRVLGAMNNHKPVETQMANFDVRFMVSAEPSLMIANIDKVNLQEAVDDTGQSLIPIPQNENITTAFGNQYSNINTNSIYMSIPLRYPNTPGHKITRLRGTIPITLLGIKSNPVSASLIKNLNVPSSQLHSILTVHDLKKQPNSPIITVELTLDRQELGSQYQLGFNPMNRFQNSAPNNANGWLQFVDVEGHQVDRIALTPYNLPNNQRRNLQFTQSDGSKPAVEVRLLDATWATENIPFTFQDIPMP